MSHMDFISHIGNVKGSSEDVIVGNGLLRVTCANPTLSKLGSVYYHPVRH